ncbi:hypothetical protein FW320_11575 [Azospirillum sp. Vi22]|uniref:hypothetical protein n=1 Tax=Azospirillum baldaniorum TaxID=1064539 RepID=UPI00157B3738|nr:hypothetical protein [Azospirillum baldaniorum]NUB06812.1 hypothetical protein [Azospirillum baldaniorum]
MNLPETAPVTIDTSVENIRDAVIRAGFRPGRRVRVSVAYADADEAREAEIRRLSAILDKHPLPPEFRNLTEERAAEIADEAVAERRTVRQRVRK